MPLKLAILDFLGRTVYHEPEPPPRVREKPMEVLCVGFPRSATESLQVALLKLGYDYTYHVCMVSDVSNKLSGVYREQLR